MTATVSALLQGPPDSPFVRIMDVLLGNTITERASPFGLLRTAKALPDMLSMESQTFLFFVLST